VRDSRRAFFYFFCKATTGGGKRGIRIGRFVEGADTPQESCVLNRSRSASVIKNQKEAEGTRPGLRKGWEASGGGKNGRM